MFFDFALTLANLPPQYLFHFQAYLPLTFWITLLDAFYQSLACFFVPYYVSPCSPKGFVINESVMLLCSWLLALACRMGILGYIVHIIKLIINWLNYTPPKKKC